MGGVSAHGTEVGMTSVAFSASGVIEEEGIVEGVGEGRLDKFSCGDGEGSDGEHIGVGWFR